MKETLERATNEEVVTVNARVEFSVLPLFLIFWHSGGLAAKTWYVDDSVPSSGDGSTWEKAFKSIQKGIDAALDGDTVIVAEGTYFENIHFKGENITLRNTDPLDSDVVAKTIIDGNQSGSVVTFTGSELSTCILSGFTIRNGRAEGGGGIRGGALDKHTYATIRNNVITANRGWASGDKSRSDDGGGLAYCDGRIENNTIRANSSRWGGGLYLCDGVVQNNLIANNLAICGGGLYQCNGTIQNNLIATNSAESWGGGLDGCDGIIQNNTIFGNSAHYGGGGICWCCAAVRNCIIWGNGARSGAQLYESSSPSFSCIEGWTEGGERNIAQNPGFVDPVAADYRLRPGSPCKDAGANYYWFAWPERDLDRDCRLAGNHVDIGCYEYGSSPDSDGDGLRDGLEVLRGSDPLARTPPRTVHVPSEISTIQGTLCLAVDGDEVIVATGNYWENLSFCGPNVLLRSLHPQNRHTVAATIINGGGRGPVVSFLGSESDACVLSGFTIRDGHAESGGGICGGARGNHTNATIRNNVITGNHAWIGGGLAYCDGIIEKNIITGNSAHPGGGGLCYCDGRIRNNTIAANSANQGGGLYGCGGTIQNNIITGNLAGDGGGGLCFCEGRILANAIYANSAHYGGGLCLCKGTIENNKITDNSAQAYGGGLCLCEGLIQNNTIAGNQPWGGLWGCNGTIRNCIVWANGEEAWGSEVLESSTPTHSCVRGWIGAGTVISKDPLFVDPAGGDYHLRGGSPCVDAGANGYWTVWPQTDLDGNCRLAGDRVDMGCYEYGSCPDSDGDLLSDADESRTGTDPLADDTDGDGLRDGLEALCGSDPLVRTVPGLLRVPSDLPTIQEALVAALNGDEIIVAPGTYRENLQFLRPDIVLRSYDPDNPDIVATTLLDGGSGGSVVSLTGGESEACVLAGFTIRNGRGDYGGGICGGTEDNRSHATIRDNVITKNSALGGGGVAFCDGIVQDNTIAENSADCGGGLHGCKGTIQNDTITGNSAWEGGGLSDCGGTIRNDTIVGNSAGDWGGGISYCNGTIVNCIIWGNRAPDGAQVYDSSHLTYSCIEGWRGGGEGNISDDPRFADADGPDNEPTTYEDNDYHLRPGSPCIDAGTHELSSPPNTDMDGEWRPFGIEIDIGADEYVDADLDELPDYWEIGRFGTLWLGKEDDPDADGLPNGHEFLRTTDPNNADSDSDGKSDGDEVFAGTDPADSRSVFRIIEVAWTPWGTAVRWSAVPTRSYRCYFGFGLESWSPLGGIVTAGPSDALLSVFDWDAAVSRMRFYSVEVLP